MYGLITTTPGFFARVHAKRWFPDERAIQQAAGLDRVVTGTTAWDASLSSALERPISRNATTIERCYRSLHEVLTSTPQHPVAQRQLCIPGPYTLSISANSDVESIGAWLAAQIAKAPPYQTVLLLEPALITHAPQDGENETVAAVIDTIVTNIAHESILVPFGGALSEKVHAHMLDADISAMAYDIQSAPGACASLITEYGTTPTIALGIIDTLSGLIVSARPLLARIRTFVNALHTQSFESIFVLPNESLGVIPAQSWLALLQPLGQLPDQFEYS